MSDRYLGFEIEKAIDNATAAILEIVLWPLTEGQEIDRASTLEAVTDQMGSDTDAIGLDLEQKLTVIEEYGDDLGDDELTFTLDTLRSKLESLAVYAINAAARGLASEELESFFEFLEDYELDNAKISTSDTFGHFPHSAEREVGPCVVHEYRDVEDLGNHVDVWHYRLEYHGSIYIEVPV